MLPAGFGLLSDLQDKPIRSACVLHRVPERAARACNRPEQGDFASAMERVKGIEPSYSAWEAAALPLSYTRVAG